MSRPSFFAELQRRHVYKVGAAYAVAGWLLAQVVTQVLPVFGVSMLAQRILVLLLVAGFPLALVMAWVFDITPQGIVRTGALEAEDYADSAVSAGSGHRSADRKLNYLLGGLLALSLAYVAIDHAGWLARPAAKTVADAGAAPAERSIAVLPLLNSSGDPANEYFSDGLSEELIAVLAKIPDLKVIGRSSSFHFKNSNADSRTIGSTLGVATLLEGSVRRQGERVGNVAELINAADSRTLWAETYDRDARDVFAVQSEIAAAVAGQLKLTLLGTSVRSDAVPSNADLDAHTALLQGDFYANRQSEADLRRAITYYEEAIRLDPGYALAQARLSIAATLLATGWLGGAEAAVVNGKSRTAAQAALRLAPALSQAYMAEGLVKGAIEFDMIGAEAAQRRAVELATADPEAKVWLGWSLGAQGRDREADTLMRQALALDPLRTTTYIQYVRILIGMRRYDEAEALMHRMIELQPAAARARAFLAVIDLVRGRPAAALANARLEPEGFWNEFAVAMALQVQDRPAEADQALARFIERNTEQGSIQVAILYALRNDADGMFEWLDKAYGQHDAGVWLLYNDPFLLAYKNDPRFATFARKLRLPSYDTVS